MTTYEVYLKKHPQISRNRAEKLMADGICFFLKEGKDDVALLPRNSVDDELVKVYLKPEICSCNVFRTKRACPHVAAALGIIEKNGGEVPYTEPTAHVYACLDQMKRTPSSYGRVKELRFLWHVNPFLDQLPKEEKPKFALELARFYQSDSSNLTDNEFTDCCINMSDGYKVDALIRKILYQNRKDCYKAVVALMRHSYHCPFSEQEKKSILKELAEDDTLADQYMPFLAESYASYFSREQLIRYCKTVKPELLRLTFLGKLLNRLVEEEPPMYDEFLSLYNSFPDEVSAELAPEVIEKMIRAGYGNRLGKAYETMVDRIRNIDDYYRIIPMIPHDIFLAAWKTRKKRNSHRWNWDPKEWEIEIAFREDPEANPDQYYLDMLSCPLLEVIRQVRPEYQDQINQAARKIYRRALKGKERGKAIEALMLLVRGNDAIAVKYAAEWEPGIYKEELIYLAAAGLRFDCLPKLLPELKTLEVPNAAGQDQ